MCFDVSIPIRLICSTDGLLCLRSATTSFWHARCRRGPSTPTDGRVHGAASDVRRHPVADRPAARTASAGMTGRSGQMRQTTTAEARLDHGKAAGSGVTRPNVSPFGCPRVGCDRISLRRASMRQTIAPSGRESGECRLRNTLSNSRRQLV